MASACCLGERPCQHFQLCRVELLDERRQAHSGAGATQRPHGVAEIALRLALVMRLGETLARQRLVGDLTGTTVAERVVDRRACGRPFDELSFGEMCRLDQMRPHAGIALGIDHDRTKPCLDCTGRKPCLGNRLTRAGGAHDQSVLAAAVAAERDRERLAVLGTSDRDALIAQGSPSGEVDDTLEELPCQRTQRVAWTAAFGGDLGQIASCHEVFGVPMPATRAGAEGSGAECARPTGEYRMGEQDDGKRAGRPRPTQVALAHDAHGEQAQGDADRDVDRRRAKPSDQFAQRLQWIDWDFVGVLGCGHEPLLSWTGSRRPFVGQRESGEPMARRGAAFACGLYEPVKVCSERLEGASR